MHTKISPQTICELLQAFRARYQTATKLEKSRILDQYVALAECHRKHAIRLLTFIAPTESETPTEPVIGRRISGEAVREAITVLWESADRICSKRLKAVLPGLIQAMERHRHLTLAPAVRELVQAASPATIDRLLESVRTTASHRKKRKRATKPGKQIPIRTFADWKDPVPGILEIDFVSHGGTAMQGVLLWSFVATDDGWAKGNAAVVSNHRQHHRNECPRRTLVPGQREPSRGLWLPDDIVGTDNCCRIPQSRGRTRTVNGSSTKRYGLPVLVRSWIRVSLLGSGMSAEISGLRSDG